MSWRSASAPASASRSIPAVTHKRLLGGCHLTRPVVDLLTGAGFTIRELDVYYEKGSPKVVGANSLGVAQSPLT
jgi:hypothetical protein